MNVAKCPNRAVVAVQSLAWWVRDIEAPSSNPATSKNLFRELTVLKLLNLGIFGKSFEKWGKNGLSQDAQRLSLNTHSQGFLNVPNQLMNQINKSTDEQSPVHLFFA